MSYLILIRHGESEYNKKGWWTGFADPPLSKKGREEAENAAMKIKNIPVDFAFTSGLLRAQQTLSIILEKLSLDVPVEKSKALNEKDYGDFTGKNKWDVKKELGEKAFLQIRRSWDYQIPGGESLKDVFDRVVPYYKENILPKLKQGKNILVSAHGNSLRALIKYLENISDTDIPSLELATGEIYIYDIDNNGKILKKEIR